MLLQVRPRRLTVPNREKSDSEIAEHARQSNRRSETNDRHFKYSGRQYKKLERRGWRKKRGKQNSSESIALDPVLNDLRAMAHLAVEHYFPSLAGEKKEQHAA